MIKKNPYFGNLKISKAELPEIINDQEPFSIFEVRISDYLENSTHQKVKNFGCANMQYTLFIEMLIMDLIDG